MNDKQELYDYVEQLKFDYNLNPREEQILIKMIQEDINLTKDDLRTKTISMD